MRRYSQQEDGETSETVCNLSKSMLFWQNADLVRSAAAGLELESNRLRAPLDSDMLHDAPDKRGDQDDLKSKWQLFMRRVLESRPPQEYPPTAASLYPPKHTRIIYVRDLGLIGSSSMFWFSALQAAVRTHRIQMSESSEPCVKNPITIILGASWTLYPGMEYSPSLNEDRYEDRQMRFKKRCLYWESGSLGDLPDFNPPIMSLDKESGVSFGSREKGYWRSCTLVPETLDLDRERAVRLARRFQLNELRVRMAVGSVGGEIVDGPAPASDGAHSITDGWTERYIKLNELKPAIDRMLFTSENAGEARIKVSWKDLYDSHKALQGFKEQRTAWIVKAFPEKEEAEELQDKGLPKPPVDKVVQAVQSMDLDKYEDRLLGCIVDPGKIYCFVQGTRLIIAPTAKMPVTFESLHLPSDVIDSIRSLVSLPLLFPEPFRSGILSQQSMTGALLFGPPGTGKTLVAKALAAESKARMVRLCCFPFDQYSHFLFFVACSQAVGYSRQGTSITLITLTSFKLKFYVCSTSG
jgi:hypothetical protein